MAFYIASYWVDGLPVPQREALPEGIVATDSRGLDDLLQSPKDISLGAAVLLLVPFVLGAMLLIGYIMLRACNVRVFPRCRFREAPWHAWHLGRCVVVFLVLQRLVMAGVGWLEASAWSQEALASVPRVAVLAAAANVLMAGTCLFVVALVSNEQGGALTLLGLRENRVFSRVALGVTGLMMTFPLLLLAAFIMLVVGPVIGIEPRPQQLLFSARTIGPLAFVVLGISAVVVAPITEEILFRGFLYSTMRRYLGPLGAITLTALGFSLLHNYAFGALSLFVIGFLLGYLYERTGSLVASIAAHAANNLYSLLVVFVVFHSGG